VLIVTACGRSKENQPTEAWRLYKAPRIRYLKRLADELNVPFAILSAKYGLVRDGEVIEPYNTVMDGERCERLLDRIVRKLSSLGVEAVVFYRGGARKDYLRCIERACEIAHIPLFSVGYAHMGDIRKVKEVVLRILNEE